MNDAETTKELEALRPPELQARYVEVDGEPTPSPDEVRLIRKIVDRMAVADLVERHAAKATPNDVRP